MTKPVTVNQKLSEKDIKTYWVEDHEVEVTEKDIKFAKMGIAFPHAFDGVAIIIKAFEIARKRMMIERRQAALNKAALAEIRKCERDLVQAKELLEEAIAKYAILDA